MIASTKRANTGTTPAINTAGATILVAVISGASGPSISDSKGNTWTELTMRTGAFSSETSIFYVLNPSVGSGHTFTLSGTTPGAVIAAFDGSGATTAFDQENGANSTTSPVTPGSVTPGHNNELIVSGVGGQATTFTVGSGFTLVDSMVISGGSNFSVGLAYLEQGTAAAVNPSWTTGNDAACVIATFQVGAPGGGAFTGGTLTSTDHDPFSVSLGWTTSTGGTAPVTQQLQRSPAGAGTWADVVGASTSPVTDATVAANTAYDYRVAYTDATPATVYSNTVTVTTTGQVEYFATTQIGTAGSLGGDPSRTKDKVFDTDFYSFFQGPDASGDWVGIDLGSGKSGVLRRVQYAATPGDSTYDHESRLPGMKFQASNDPTFATGVVDLYTVPAEPAPVGRQWTYAAVDTGGVAYRCFRALSATNGYVTLAGLRFIGDPATGVDQEPVAPVASPWGGRFPAGSRVVTLTTVTSTATVYYTTDGTTPDNTKTRYAGPFTLTIGGSGTTLKAVAYDGSFASPYSDVTTAAFYPWGWKPDQVWYDDKGNSVQAQGGDLVYSNERWWWFGMGSNRFCGAIDVRDHYATNLYSSSDLRNWRFEGVALGTPYAGAQIYRVHVFYSTTDARWVMWVNNFVSGDQYRMLGATSGTDIRGPWSWLGTPAAPGDWPVAGGTHKFWDANRLVDDDGTNYIVINNGGTTLDVTAVDAARTGVTGSVVSPSDGEAPTPFTRGTTNFLIRSTGNYYADGATYQPRYLTCTSATPLGTWSSQTDLFTSDPVGTAYNAQPNAVLTIPGKTDGYVYVSDKWKLPDVSPLGLGLYESTQVWLPLTFASATAVQAQRPTSWDLSTFTDVYTVPVLTKTGTGATSATLSWTAASGGTSPYTYKLQRAANVYADWQDVSGGTTSPVTDTGLVQGRAYEYRVRCVDNAGVVVFSNQVTAVTAPTAGRPGVKTGGQMAVGGILVGGRL